MAARKVLPSISFRNGRFVPSRQKYVTRKEREMRDVMDLAKRIELEDAPPEPQKLSRWGLPAHTTHSFNDFPPALRKLYERREALINLSEDALDAHEHGLLDRNGYQKELTRLKPLIAKANEELDEALREDRSKTPNRRGARPTVRRRR